MSELGKRSCAFDDVESGDEGQVVEDTVVAADKGKAVDPWAGFRVQLYKPVDDQTELHAHESRRHEGVGNFITPNDERIVSDSVRGNHIPLFERASVTDLMDTFEKLVGGEILLDNDIMASGLTVQGIPGCGKTMTTWLFIKVLVASGIPCAWYKADLQTLYLFDPVSATTATSANVADQAPRIIGSITTKDFVSDIQAELSNREFGFVVIDSITHENFTPQLISSMTWLSRRKDTFFALVMSLQTNLPEKRLDSLHCKRYMMSPWSLKEYITACKDEVFFKSVFSKLHDDNYGLTEQECIENELLRNELIIKKYPIAGVSARWMFDYKSAKVITNISSYLSKVDDYQLLQRGNTGSSRSMEYVNALRYDEGSSFNFTSSEVLRRLLKRMDDAKVNEYTTQLLCCRFNNPVIERTILEVDLIRRVETHSVGDRLYRVNPETNSLLEFKWERPSCIMHFHKDIITDEENERESLVLATRTSHILSKSKSTDVFCFDCFLIMKHG